MLVTVLMGLVALLALWLLLSREARSLESIVRGKVVVITGARACVFELSSSILDRLTDDEYR